MRRAALLVVVLLLGAACTGGDPAVRQEGRATTEPTEEPARSEDPEPEPDDEPDASADPHGELACSDGDLSAIDAVIDDQLEAFVDDDYAGALELASEDFREGFDEERFRDVIEEGFPIVAEATGHTSDVCVRDGGNAQLLVTVEGESGQEAELVYLMVREGGEWRIGGAEPAGAGDDDGVRV